MPDSRYEWGVKCKCRRVDVDKVLKSVSDGVGGGRVKIIVGEEDRRKENRESRW